MFISVILLAGIAGCSGKEKEPKDVEVDLTEYINLTIEGQDGDGYALFEFDYDSLLKDLFDHEDRGEFFEDEEDDVTDLIEEMTIEISDIYYLSNGDVLTYKVEYDEDDAEDLGIVFLELSDVTVEGLEVPQDYNPFDDVTVTYSGISPFVEVNIVYDCSLDYTLYVNFSTDKEYYAKGETVLITADYNEYDAEEYAYVIVTQTEKEYVAEAEYEYILEASQLTDQTEMFDYIYGEVQDHVTSKIAADASSYYFGLDLTDIYGYSESGYNTIEFNGEIVVDSAYLLTYKMDQTNYSSDVNQLAIIFKFQVSFPDVDSSATFDVYMYAVIPDIQLDADGKIFVAYSDLFINQESPLTLIATYDKLVTENINDYDVIEIPIASIPAFPSLSTDTETVANETTAETETTEAP